MQTVYINSIGKFLPGPAISNDSLTNYLGPLDKRQSLIQKKALKQNKIVGRHYALNQQGEHQYTVVKMAKLALKEALLKSEVNLKDIQSLICGTSQGDLLAPGLSSYLHHSIPEMPTLDVASFSSFCASSMMALKMACSQIRSKEKQNAIVCASEFPSRFMHEKFLRNSQTSNDVEFLRWMLSDGAAAMILEDKPNEHHLSFRVDYIDLMSYANIRPLCMYAGAKYNDNALTQHWSSFSDMTTAKQEGVFYLHQNFKLLSKIVPIGFNRYLQLVDQGLISPSEISRFLVHFSSGIFHQQLLDVANHAGAPLDPGKIFTNLYTKGNTGSAALFIMLEELFHSGELKNGDKLVCMVPESGGFIISYLVLTCVAGKNTQEFVKPTPTMEIPLETSFSNTSPQEKLIRKLMQVWVEFESNLNRVPIIDKLNRGKFRLEDYKLILLNVRQQVVEGARWIARAASNIQTESFDLRSLFIAHANDEHRDFKMLENNYVSIGGKHEDILQYEKNIGSEALSAFMFHKSSQDNPFDLLGAMFIIEGLGKNLANQWGESIRQQLHLKPEQVSFLLYHGSNDENHMEKLFNAIELLKPDEKMVNRIVKTAKVVARLYQLQLEEIGNI